MGAIRDLAERAWSGALGGDTIGLIAPTFAHEEIAPGLHFIHSFANVAVLRTGEGLVLVDTGSFLTRRRMFEAVRHSSSSSSLHTCCREPPSADCAASNEPAETTRRRRSTT